MHQSAQYQLRAPRSPGLNAGTLMIERPVRQSPSCEVAFISHYEQITATLRAAERPSLAMFVFDDEGLAARAVLPASPDRVRCATVGRHDRVELLLPEDPSLALRQLAILVPATARPSDAVGAGTAALRYRVLDLRTQLGMRDEFEQPLDGFEADGPMFVSVGRYTVLLIPRTTGPLGWPTDPLAAWQRLPRRSYRRTTHHRARLESQVPVGAQGPVNTLVQVLPGVSMPADCTHVVDARPIGFLNVTSSATARATCGQTTVRARLVLDRQTARSGVLLGRYDRCETGGSPVLDDALVSRVHALVVEVEGRTTIMDLGSVNGLWLGEQRIRVHELAPGDEIGLGRGAVSVRWEPV